MDKLAEVDRQIEQQKLAVAAFLLGFRDEMEKDAGNPRIGNIVKRIKGLAPTVADSLSPAAFGGLPGDAARYVKHVIGGPGAD